MSTSGVPTNDVDRRLSALPETGYVYRTSWRVPTGDVDGNLHLRLDGVARYIQEAVSYTHLTLPTTPYV